MAKQLISARIHGMKGVRAVGRGQVDTITPAINKAMEQLAKDIAATARAMAPLGKTGRLKASIMAHGIEDKRWQVTAGNRDAFYARFQEFGTRHNRAHPFLIPAFELYRKQISERIAKAIKAGFKAGARGRSRGKTGV